MIYNSSAWFLLSNLLSGVELKQKYGEVNEVSIANYSLTHVSGGTLIALVGINK